MGDKNEVDEAITNAKSVLEGDDPAAIDAAHQRLEGALHKVAEHLYKAQAEAEAEAAAAADPGAAAGAGEAGGAAPPASDDEDIIDAEYTEEK